MTNCIQVKQLGGGKNAYLEENFWVYPHIQFLKFTSLYIFFCTDGILPTD